MNLRRYFGATSRSVLEQVRAELGPEALIVSNRPLADGIEITALAPDAMASLLAAAAPATGGLLPSAQDAPVLPPPAAPAALSSAPVPVAACDDVASVTPSAIAAVFRSRHAAAAAETSPAATARDAAIRSTPAERDVLATLRAEMSALRTFVRDEIAGLAWNEALRRHPLRAQLTRELLRAGFGPELARRCTAALPDDFAAPEAQQWLAREIAAGIRVAATDVDLVDRGGVYALTGATGVGKTTTTAKLAARCAVRRGAQSLALVTTDSYRVGAHDQLRIYARILGIGVHTVNGPDDLRQTLDSLRGKHLVLIDTVGMGQRDARLREHAAILAQPEVQRLLVLAATAQADTQDDVVEAYRPTPAGLPDSFAGCIVTKLDEAARIGDILDVIIRHAMPVHYLSTGQRVPEDLHAPNVPYLVNRALRAGARSRRQGLADDEVRLVTAPTAGAFHA